VRNGCQPFLVTIQPTTEAKPDPPPVHEKAKPLLKEFETVFENLPSGLPPERGTFRIHTGDSQPVSNRGYPG
jgi:hypothetical protein